MGSGRPVLTARTMRAVLDSNILIDHLRGLGAAGTEIARYAPAVISPITWIEVMAGASEDVERAALRTFLASFELAPWTRPIMERAALLRNETRLRLPDAIVLATALCDDLILVTRNTKDFDPRIWPNIRVPYDVR